jgi:hypothetical protein
MKDTEAERITDTFRYHHHAIPVPHITPTDRIIVAARRLADAIQGVQEAPLDELAAIASLRLLILGKTLPPDPTPPVNPATDAPSGEPSDDDPTIDEPPVIMWDPMADIAPPAVRPASHSPTVRLAVIPLYDNGVEATLRATHRYPPLQRGNGGAGNSMFARSTHVQSHVANSGNKPPT